MVTAAELLALADRLAALPDELGLPETGPAAMMVGLAKCIEKLAGEQACIEIRRLAATDAEHLTAVREMREQARAGDVRFPPVKGGKVHWYEVNDYSSDVAPGRTIGMTRVEESGQLVQTVKRGAGEQWHGQPITSRVEYR